MENKNSIMIFPLSPLRVLRFCSWLIELLFGFEFQAFRSAFLRFFSELIHTLPHEAPILCTCTAAAVSGR